MGGALPQKQKNIPNTPMTTPARVVLIILCLIANVSAAVHGCVFYGHVDTLHWGIVVGLIAPALLAAVDLRRLKQP